MLVIEDSFFFCELGRKLQAQSSQYLVGFFLVIASEGDLAWIHLSKSSSVKLVHVHLMDLFLPRWQYSIPKLEDRI